MTLHVTDEDIRRGDWSGWYAITQHPLCYAMERHHKPWPCHEVRLEEGYLKVYRQPNSAGIIYRLEQDAIDLISDLEELYEQDDRDGYHGGRVVTLKRVSAS